MHMYHKNMFHKSWHRTEALWRLCRWTYQWRCQSLGTSQKPEQQDVYVYKNPLSDSWPERDQTDTQHWAVGKHRLTHEQTETPAANKQDVDQDPVLSSATSSTNLNIASVDGMILVQKMTEEKNRDNQHIKRSSPEFQRQAHEFDSRIQWGYSGIWYIQTRLTEREN